MKRTMALTVILLAIILPDWAGATGQAQMDPIGAVDASAVDLPDFPVWLFQDKEQQPSPLSLDTKQFTRREESHFSLGYSRDVWWVYFKLSNPTSASIRRVLHYEDGFMIDDLQLFVVRDGEALSNQKEGIYLPVQRKYLPDSGAVFPLNLGPGEQSEIFLRIQTKSPMLVSLRLGDVWHYQRHKVFRNVFYAMVFGAIMVMMIYNLFLAFSLKSMEYLYYVVYVFCASIYIAAQTGFAVEHFGLHGELRGRMFYSVYVVAVALFLFSRLVLETPKRIPRTDKAIKGFIALNICGIGLGLVFGLQDTLFIQSPLILVSSIFLLTVGVIAQANHAPTAKFFVAATGTFLLSTAVATLLFIKAAPYNFITRNAYFIGIVIEAVLLSLLLSYRIHLLRQEKTQAQEAFLETERKAKVELEQKVAERTRDLQVAMKNADIMARTDALTGLKNRRDFFEIGRLEVEKCKRYQRDMSVVVIDIDWFKEINDTFGHEAGDRVLLAFAQTLSSVAREVDILARIGGEEFAALLPETKVSQAAILTERMRIAVESLRMEEDGRMIGVTASFGVAGLGEGEASLDAILARADKALYQAKSQGRNQVVVA